MFVEKGKQTSPLFDLCLCCMHWSVKKTVELSSSTTRQPHECGHLYVPTILHQNAHLVYRCPFRLCEGKTNVNTDSFLVLLPWECCEDSFFSMENVTCTSLMGTHGPKCVPPPIPQSVNNRWLITTPLLVILLNVFHPLLGNINDDSLNKKTLHGVKLRKPFSRCRYERIATFWDCGY